MAPDEKQSPPRAHDRIEWFTVSYRTLALLAIALVLAGVLVWMLYGRPTPPPPPLESVPTVARFVSVDGSVQVKRSGTLEWVSATLATALRQNDLVRTGSGGTAEIVFADGTSVSVRPDSLITLDESSQNPASRQQRLALTIQSGEANFQTAGRGVPGSATFSTPTVRTTAERDTAGNIQVAQSGETGLRIFRGAGQAETRTGQRIALASNEGVRVDSSGAAGAKVALPVVPQLTAPSNGTDIAYPDLGQGITLLLWNAVPQATAYRVMVDFSPSFARPLYDRRGFRGTQMELRGLEAGSYYWRVAALEPSGTEGGFSEMWRFTLSKAAVSPPPLAIDTLEMKGNVLHVSGRTEPGATLLLNGVALPVQPDGSFNEFLTFEGTPGGAIVLRSTSPRGGVAELKRPVATAS
jgi:hypothetical protein